MNETRSSIKIILLLLVTLGSFAQAEPWLANRFAQNCASCHSPGRVNLPPSERRCTLSCQGCHVSPSGGGLRNLYGKWLEERWLSTWTPKGWKLAKPKPAPLALQPYENQKLLSYAGGKTDAAKPRTQTDTIPVMRTTSAQVDEAADFNKHNTAHEKIIETDYAKFLMTVPEGDPLRETRDATVIAGLDMRYFYFSRTISGDTKNYSVPMNTDIGVQVRPIEHASAVIEARFANGPTAANQNSEWDNMFTSQPLVKSAYVLIDDLPYNSWASYGLGRPLFGNSNPDHTSLMNGLTYGVNNSMRSVYKTASFGTAPNVPFLNVHLVSPISNQAYSQDRGYVINAGGRFVTYGASVMMSYWNTDSTSLTESRREMTSLTIGGKLWRWIGVFEANRIRRNTANFGTDSGTVVALENKFKLWRENYLILNYAKANTARDLTFGESTEQMVGFRSFPISGLDVELLYAELKNAPYADESRVQGQVHFFF